MTKKEKKVWHTLAKLLAALLAGVVVTQPQLVEPQLAAVLQGAVEVLDAASL